MIADRAADWAHPHRRHRRHPRRLRHHGLPGPGRGAALLGRHARRLPRVSGRSAGPSHGGARQRRADDGAGRVQDHRRRAAAVGEGQPRSSRRPGRRCRARHSTSAARRRPPSRDRLPAATSPSASPMERSGSGPCRSGPRRFLRARLPKDAERLGERDYPKEGAFYRSLSADQLRKLTVETALERAVRARGGRRGRHRRAGLPSRRNRRAPDQELRRRRCGRGRAAGLAARAATNLLTGEVDDGGHGLDAPAAAARRRDPRAARHAGRRPGLCRRCGRHASPLRHAQLREPHPCRATQAVPGRRGAYQLGIPAGEQSLVAGGSDGSVDVYFRLARPSPGPRTATPWCARTHSRSTAAAVTAFDASERSKLFVTADASGEVWLRHATEREHGPEAERRRGGEPGARSRSRPGTTRAGAGGGRGGGALGDRRSPSRDDAPARSSARSGTRAIPEPGYTWQSSSGTDAFEPKLSLVPLIFGTLKATFYSLLFAIPIALLGGDLHLRVPAPAGARGGEADDGDDGLAAVRGARLPRRAGPRAGGRELDRGGDPRLRRWCRSALLLAAHLWQVLPQPAWRSAASGVAEVRDHVPRDRRGARLAPRGAWRRPSSALFFAGDFQALGERRCGQRRAAAGPAPAAALRPRIALARSARSLGDAHARFAAEQSGARPALVEFGRWVGFLLLGGLVSLVLADRCSPGSASTRAAACSAPMSSATRWSSASPWASP